MPPWTLQPPVIVPVDAPGTLLVTLHWGSLLTLLDTAPFRAETRWDSLCILSVAHGAWLVETGLCLFSLN